MRKPREKKVKWLEERSWKSFKDAGMLWFVNRILHVFGWAIVAEVDHKGKILTVYPARCKFRGFGTKTERQGFQRVSRYIAKHSKQLLKDLDL